MKTIVDELIEYLVNKKEDLGQLIENITYDDLKHDLSLGDLIEINKKRKMMNDCYEMIDYLENAVKKFMEG